MERVSGVSHAPFAWPTVGGSARATTLKAGWMGRMPLSSICSSVSPSCSLSSRYLELPSSLVPS